LAIDVRSLKVSFEPDLLPDKICLAVLDGFATRLVRETHMLRRSNAEQSDLAQPGQVKGAGIQDAVNYVGTLVEGSRSESWLQREGATDEKSQPEPKDMTTSHIASLNARSTTCKIPLT